MNALARSRATSPLSASDVVDAYYEKRKRRLQPSTQHHYEQIIAKHIRPKIGPLSARELSDNPAPLQDFYNDLPPTTALHAHQILRPAFQYAVDHRQLERNPCSVATPPRKRRAEKLIPTSDEVSKIVLGARDKDSRFGLFIWLVSRLGLRRGEACALRWEDFEFDRREVKVRRTIARRTGGTYIKKPKSGESRTLQMDARFFEQLEPFRETTGWVFPRAYNCPFVDDQGLTPHSTAGRLLAELEALGGTLRSPEGRAGIETARILGLRKHSAGPMIRQLHRDGYISREGNRSRTFAISLADRGREAIEGWKDRTDDGLPWFPTTADQKFGELMDELDMPYTLHSLRHFVATHLYNRERDWVQLARFLGHSSPAITMNLYANHVVDASQVALGSAAMDLYDDPEISYDPEGVEAPDGIRSDTTDP
jgi:integrase